MNAAAETRNAATGISRARRLRRPRQAGQHSEQLQAMLVDPKAGLAGDVPDHPPQSGVVDLGRSARS